MMSDNICLFPKNAAECADLSIVRFVYEREAKNHPLLLQVMYTFALVTQGKGILHSIRQWQEPLQVGDFFITVPGRRYSIENTENLQYIYISVTGARVPGLLQRIDFERDAPVYHGREDLIAPFIEGITGAQPENTDFISESLLLLAMSKLSILPAQNRPADYCRERIFEVKEYIDIHFADRDLNLEQLELQFGYSSKYLSQRFRSAVGIGMREYINGLRMDYAMKCIVGGMTTVKEISLMCGYTDPLYFSKCFRAKYGISPKNYILSKS